MAAAGISERSGPRRANWLHAAPFRGADTSERIILELQPTSDSCGPAELIILTYFALSSGVGDSPLPV